jgi:hypothetical protein
MYGAKSPKTDALAEKISWWSLNDRWIPPQQLHWTLPLLTRLRWTRHAPFRQSPWLRVS